MANRRTLKKNITMVCGELLKECVAMSLYGADTNKENAEALFFAIVKMQDNFIRRISHQEPGIPAKLYYRNLCEEFSAQVGEILDQINS